MLDFSIYLLYRAGTAIASALPVRVLFAIGNLMGWGAWLLLPHYRRLARRNLEIAFANEKSPRELRRIARRHFQRLGANLSAVPKWDSMPPKDWRNISKRKISTPCIGSCAEARQSPSPEYLGPGKYLRSFPLVDYARSRPFTKNSVTVTLMRHSSQAGTHRRRDVRSCRWIPRPHRISFAPVD